MSSGSQTAHSAETGTSAARHTDADRFGAVRVGYRHVVERIGHTRWFAAAMRAVGARIDVRLYRLSGGRLSIAGPSLFPVLLLSTTGRRSGQPRTTPIIYVRGDEDALVVSSESFGQKKPAGWALNLAADPHAVVRLGSRSGAYTAHLAGPDEVERYWPALLKAWPAHQTYFERSGVRKVYVLEPVGAD